MNIVLLGAPASGKGTQAKLIAKEYNLFHFQTGDLARDLAEKNERIKKIVNSGQLIPEEEMTLYAIDHLKEVRTNLNNILFEGFPRFVSQYEALENFLVTKGSKIDAVINLEISKEEAVKRISSRRICKKCNTVYNLMTNPPKQEGKCDCGGDLIQRDDDKPASIQVRFKYYQDNTKKLTDYLQKNEKLIQVDGERPIEDIFQDIVNKLKPIANENSPKN